MTETPAAATDDTGTPLTDNIDDTDIPTGPEGRFAAALRRLWGPLRPPQIWAEDRPCLAKVHAYARRGAWGPDHGLARTLGVAYGLLVALPVTAIAYLTAWVFERPSRLAAVVALGVVLFYAARIP